MTDRADLLRQLVEGSLMESLITGDTSPKANLFFGLMMGIRLHSSDPALAEEVFQVMSGAHDRSIPAIDEVAAMWRDVLNADGPDHPG